MKNSTLNIAGVDAKRENGKWLFTAAKSDKEVYNLIVSGRASEAQAIKIATEIGASVKRGFVGNVLDNMAVGKIRKLTAIPAYTGINFSFAK